MTIAIKTQPRNSDKLYTHLLEKKRVWTPTEAAKGFVAEGSENSLDRAMCLRKLELPVGEFIKSGCAKEDGLSDICITLLESNIQDEVKHDIALENLYRVCGQHNKKHEEEADQLVQAWLDLPDHPFVKALYAERSVFFVILPMFRWLGTGNISMRNVASEISGDEIGHVSANTELEKSLNLSPSNALNQLRKDTINFVVRDLEQPKNYNQANHSKSFKPQYLNKDYWIRQSDMLYSGTKAPEMISTTASRMLSFFEIDKRQLTSYS
jgi:hypothetical protein